MSQSILLTGVNSEIDEINVIWSDNNGRRHGSTVQITIEEESNHKRALCVYVNTVRVAIVPCTGVTEDMARTIAQLLGVRTT